MTVKFKDKQTLTIITLTLIDKLVDKDNMPRLPLELVSISERDLVILKQILPNSELVQKITNTSRVSKYGFNATVAEVQELIKEINSERN